MKCMVPWEAQNQRKLLSRFENGEKTEENAIASIKLNKQTYAVRTCDGLPYQIKQTNLYVGNISYHTSKQLCLWIRVPQYGEKNLLRSPPTRILFQHIPTRLFLAQQPWGWTGHSLQFRLKSFASQGIVDLNSCGRTPKKDRILLHIQERKL